MNDVIEYYIGLALEEINNKTNYPAIALGRSKIKQIISYSIGSG